MAEDIEAYWQNLKEGKDCMTEIPKDRWDWRDYYGDPAKEANKTNVNQGGFIDGIAEFAPQNSPASPSGLSESRSCSLCLLSGSARKLQCLLPSGKSR